MTAEQLAYQNAHRALYYAAMSDADTGAIPHLRAALACLATASGAVQKPYQGDAPRPKVVHVPRVVVAPLTGTDAPTARVSIAVALEGA